MQPEKYFKHFDLIYMIRIRAKAASDAGMKYFVITTKHHEGFCLWIQINDYKATNTPACRDLLKPMVDAFRKQNMKVGFYHSLLDWHHPHYTVDICHPMSENEEYIAADKEKHRKICGIFTGQVRELLTEYGKIDIIWFDFSVAPGERFGKGQRCSKVRN